MEKLTLALKSSHTDIYIGEEILSKLGSYLLKAKLPGRVIVISDSNVSKIYGGVVKHALRSSGLKCDVLSLPQGERTKSIEFAKKLCKSLLEMGARRDCVLLALGGGVIGDLTGFVASTYMRGVDLIQVPTTLLAQVDAGIGGKTGVNTEEAKNIIGTFYQPKIVFSDVAALITLPPKEIRNGLAEVIKYGVIADPSLFELLEKQIQHLKLPKLAGAKDIRPLLSIWKNIVKRSAAIKVSVVRADEREMTGKRLVLNFGHTVGHAIEALEGYKGLSHGESVAVGMVAASRIALKLKLIKKEKAGRIEALIKAANLPAEIKGLDAEDIIAKLILDKKVRDGKIVFVLPRSIGSIVIKNDVPVRIVRQVLKEMGAK